MTLFHCFHQVKEGKKKNPKQESDDEDDNGSKLGDRSKSSSSKERTPRTKTKVMKGLLMTQDLPHIK